MTYYEPIIKWYGVDSAVDTWAVEYIRGIGNGHTHILELLSLIDMTSQIIGEKMASSLE